MKPGLNRKSISAQCQKNMLVKPYTINFGSRILMSAMQMPNCFNCVLIYIKNCFIYMHCILHFYIILVPCGVENVKDGQMGIQMKDYWTWNSDFKTIIRKYTCQIFYCRCSEWQPLFWKPNLNKPCRVPFFAVAILKRLGHFYWDHSALPKRILEQKLKDFFVWCSDLNLLFSPLWNFAHDCGPTLPLRQSTLKQIIPSVNQVILYFARDCRWHKVGRFRHYI